MARALKRSSQPPLWLLFGAGGMLSALIGAALVFATGIAVPLGWLLPPDAMDYPHALAFARNPLAKVFILAVISLFLWHAAHRIYHTLHDFGVRPGALQWLACYGTALAATVAAAVALLLIGF